MKNPYPVFRDAAADRMHQHRLLMVSKQKFKRDKEAFWVKVVLIVGTISAVICGVITYFFTR